MVGLGRSSPSTRWGTDLEVFLSEPGQLVPRRALTPPEGERRRAARPVPSDKSLDRGLTFNRSQQVSCSATHETLTQNQVVYE